ncbi:MAG: hypothetical protein RIR00_2063, partial [Pseudomonadota bacterium]
MTQALSFQAVAHIKTELKNGRQRLREQYEAKPDAGRLLTAHCKLIDRQIKALWKLVNVPEEVALCAVGGYGRGELYPASDIDLLILLPDEPDEVLQGQLEQLIGLFWDIGLEVGHSVRTLDDCIREAEADITVQTALIEARLLTGCAELFARFEQRLNDFLDVPAFFKAKRLEQQERYLRFQETPYSLEANCKESPGGLRDLQVILWIASAAGYGRTWRDLERRGFITNEETIQLQRCERFLQHLRIRLHYTVRRREDRLLFDHQSALAQQFGLEATESRRASEVLMQRYYRTAKAITQLNTILLQNIAADLLPQAAQDPEPINARFQIVQDMLDITSDQAFEHEPSAILESFLLLQQHPELRGMTAPTLRALWHARSHITPAFRKNPYNRALFLQLFQSQRGIVHEFRRMNQYGIIGRYLPAFGKIVGQMQHDLFHVYTVDQHIMQVLRNLRRFTMEEFAHEYPMCSRLIYTLDRHWLLYIAAIFHDIAKGRGGDHSELGTSDAREFCENHSLHPLDTELVVWLVRNHLVMSQVAQKEDLSDPDVIRDFAERVGDERHLTALYLLTHADIRGTSPKVWNHWKGKLLADLYHLTLERLESKVETAPHGVIVERQKEALRLLRYFALSDTVQERLWKQLDTVYFLRHSAEEIAWHTRSLYYRIYNDQPVVKARPHEEGGLQVMVYTLDQPDLFARVVGFFARIGYSILDAKIHTTRHGYALDSFVLIDTTDQRRDREMVSYIEHELGERLRTQAALDVPPSGRLSRQVKHFPITPEVTIRPDDKATHYLLTVVCADRPGLLYTIATTIIRHGANMHTAKITTLGERVEDVFLLSGGDLSQSTG